MNHKRNSAYAELVAEIRMLSQSQGLNTVFTTFLELMATSLSAQMDPCSASHREKRYEDIVSGLTKEVISAYGRMCALMYLAVKEHEDNPCDILMRTR